MPSSSHSSYDAWPTPTATAHLRTAAAATSRSGRVSCFESRIPRRCSGGGTTAQTVTGPAHAPRPTSSMPHTTWSPLLQSRRSSRRVGNGGRTAGRTVVGGGTVGTLPTGRASPVDAYRAAMPEPFRLRGLHQVGQRATDLDRAVSFYQDVLGLTFIAKFDPPGLAFFDLGNVRLLLENGAHSSVLYLDVEDIDAAYATLQARGVEFVGAPHLVFRDDNGQFGAAGEEEWMAFFQDPDGNTLALLERRPAHQTTNLRQQTLYNTRS